ncbi:hypothetical protein F8S13_22215 [Chloroflexia bacterium SDU3-3]|nr:hypothetical protein F8S13_22215 [Chloroflexia bacterium SDU3-3]
MTYTPWESRPTEIANLINPGFCSLLLCSAVSGYQISTGYGAPYALMYLILPIVLYPPARRNLPKNTKTLLPMWIQNHSDLQYHITSRVPVMFEYTRESLTFGLQHGVIQIQDDGLLYTNNKVISDKTIITENQETNECLLSSSLLGRWFGKVNNPSFILTLWGLQP